jgi:hypothetical protein
MGRELTIGLGLAGRKEQVRIWNWGFGFGILDGRSDSDSSSDDLLVVELVALEQFVSGLEALS